MAALDKHSKQIRFAVRVILFDEVIDVCTQVACACVRRIRSCHPILPRQGLADVNQPVQLLGGTFHTHTVHADLTSGIPRCHKSAQQIPVVALHIQNRAILLGIGQSVQQAFQLIFSSLLLAIVHPCAEIMQVRPVDAVTLLHGIDMAGVFTVKNAAVILSGFHHHGKVRQLISTVINVQTVNIVFQNALCSITLAVTGTLVNLHQHIKSVYEDMTGTHAGVDELYILRVQGSVFFTNSRQFCLHLRLLLCLFQIVFPVFFQAAVRVSFHPQTAKAVFHHVTNDPVRGKQLGHGRDFLFGNLTVLGKGSGLRLSVVILVQPADDLHLTTALDVEVILRNVMDQVIDHTILVNNGQAEQQLGVVLCLFKQSRQNLVQGIALFQEQDAEHLVQLVVLL